MYVAHRRVVLDEFENMGVDLEKPQLEVHVSVSDERLLAMLLLMQQKVPAWAHLRHHGLNVKVMQMC